MKHFQLALLCFICVTQNYVHPVNESYGKIDVEITVEKRPKRIYAKVEIKSVSPGVDSSWAQSFENTLNQSIRVDKRAKKGKYVVSVQFIVAKDGVIADVRCLNDPGFGMCAAVVRVLKKYPKWLPGEVKPYRS